MRDISEHETEGLEPDDLTMLVRAASNGALLEIGVITAEGIDFIVHAMSARPKYLGD